MRSKTGFAIFLLAVLAAIYLLGTFALRSGSAQSQSSPSFRAREDAYRSNNLGVAHLEQFDYGEAAKAFRKALEIDPTMKIARINLAIALLNLQEIGAARSAAEDDTLKIAPELPQTHYLLGLIARNENRTDDALAAFNRVLDTDPADVGTNFNIGQIYTEQRKYAEAIQAFRRAYDAEPYNSSAIYNLATALIRTEQREEGQRLIDQFQKLRQSGAATSIGQNYLEQGRYAEALVSTGAEPELVEPLTSPPVFDRININSTGRAGNYVNATALFDYDRDNDLDIVAVVEARFVLLRNDRGQFINVSGRSGELSASSGAGVTGIVAGDLDNDSNEDILFFGRGRPGLFRGDGKGGFSNVSGKLPPLVGTFSSGAFVDVDHDGDLDIFLGGSVTVGRSVPNKLIRNNGDGSFSDISSAAKIGSGSSSVVSVIPTDFDNRRDVDLLVLISNQHPNLFQNLRDGTFRDVAESVGLVIEGEWISAAAGDFNKDSFVDFFFGRRGQAGVFAISTGKGRFTMQEAPPTTDNAFSAQFADFDNDGLLDLIAVTPRGVATLRNVGSRWEAVVSKITGAGSANSFAPTSRMVSGDIDRDGDIDVIIAGNRGPLHFLRNTAPKTNRSTLIALKGRASNRVGIGSKIDVRAGSLSQKLETYSASPMPAPSEVQFGLGRREIPDAVRVIWPSGVIQAELSFSQNTGSAGRPLTIEELDRKPSSCPYLYTWNGKEFEFITDFLGGGEMGNWKEHGAYHFPDSDEFVRIPSDKLKPKDGKYEIRVTNELEEVLFLDHLKLIAVEHPAGTEVYPNEGLGIPTAGQRITYTTEGEHAPLSALDGEGRDVLKSVKDLDYRFYDSFKPLEIRGYAGTHRLTLNVDDRRGYNGRTLLLLTGWTDYAFSSDNLAASQSGKSLFFPKLQVKNRRGEWQTVIDSIGISVGRPQTVVVDLTGKFLTDSREVRIVTNVKTYWDKVAVDTSGQANLRMTELSPVRAELRERGFSDKGSYAGMIVPTYERVLNDARWKYFSGRFTRTGDVRPLLDRVDDVFVISKTGDEVVLNFDAPPTPPAGRTLTFFLFADGYSKEMDINSGSPDAVLPLPFKGMTKYPYGGTERFPMTAEKQQLYDEYTTRVVNRLFPRVEASLLR